MLIIFDYDWECVDFWVNEGLVVFKNNGKIFIVFFVSVIGVCYCMGYMEVDENSDLFDCNFWIKICMLVFEISVEKKIFGFGYNCFIVVEDGEILLCVYYVCDYEYVVGELSVVLKIDMCLFEEIVKDLFYDLNCYVCVLEVKFDENGCLLFELY